MGLFGKKKKPEGTQEDSYEIFGGFSIIKNAAGHEIKWRSPNLTTITVSSEPFIDEKVETQREENKTNVLTKECRLKIRKENGETKAYVYTF